jgi:chemotaxis protein histidine kinase CheA
MPATPKRKNNPAPVAQTAGATAVLDREDASDVATDTASDAEVTMERYTEVTAEEVLSDLQNPDEYDTLSENQVSYVATRVAYGKAVKENAPKKIQKELRESLKEWKEALESDEEKIPLQAEDAAAASAKAKKPAPQPKKDKTKDCLCGCGGRTKGGLFIPGHDAKLKSFLLKVEKGEADVNTLPQATRDQLDTCACCGMPMLKHPSGKGPICRTGNCRCKEKAAAKAEADAAKAAKRAAKAEADAAAKAASDAVKAEAAKKK